MSFESVGRARQSPPDSGNLQSDLVTENVSRKSDWFFRESTPYFRRPLRARVKKSIVQTVSLAAATLLLPNNAATASAAGPDQAGIEFFEQKIRPVLVEHCYKCHSKDSEKIKGGLRLDTRDGLLKGGDTGPALIAGDVEKSLLIKAVRYTDEDLRMPPRKSGGKLSDEQIADLEAWIRMGAPDPRASDAVIQEGPPLSDPEKVRNHWAFKLIRSNPKE
ncbi:MAG: hypothetical protein DME19_20410 [Verrucomicrobia bacterium]|nr:MAG: hypothetical protein DME19_20410 [Verrucomicrobiota bacterium]